jgi:predicted  nucleic acid-binding Zn-ribbon protein
VAYRVVYLRDTATPAQLKERIDRLRKEISCIEEKKVGITQAIESRKRTLARLEAQAALAAPLQPAPTMTAG